MTGFGISGGALSIVNAIASGFGAAFGVSLSTKAEVREGDRVSLRINGTAAPAYFAESLLERFNQVSREKLSGAAVSVESDIPQSAGLKSSSAAANAILSAFADEAGVTLSPDTILRAGALASLDAGVSVTGAFDDAAACLLGGLVFTDNTAGKVISRRKMPEDLAVVIHTPAYRIATNAFPKDALRQHAAESRALFARALCGDIAHAMYENGRLVCGALGMAPETADRALFCGAQAAGLSGTGPATGILVAMEDVDAFLEKFGRENCIITTLWEGD